MDKVNDDKKDGEGKPRGQDLFYWENGLVVFTEAYHRRRGYCCKNGCRHCPYGFNKNSNG